MDNSADNDIVAAAIHMAIQGPRRGRDAVDALISRLSPWELLYLRSRARGIQVDATQANGFATCANLPADILRLIVEYLSPHDLPSFRRVSRGWKRVWMQPDILRVVFRQHFPGLLEFHPEDQDLERLFLDTMSRYQCKSQQECYSTVVPWDINVTLRSHPADGRSILPLPTNSLRRSMHYPGPHSLYYNGRVVWQPALGQIVVDDLRSGHRARYAAGVDPRRRRSEGKLAALTDTLVVLASCRSPSGAVSSSPRFLHIYHLKHKTWKDLTLPAGMAWIFAHTESIVTACHGRQSFIWTWNGILEMLPTDHEVYNAQPPHSRQLFGGIPGALLHPQKSNIVFLVWVYSYDLKGRESSLYSSSEASRSLYTTVVVRYERGQNARWVASARFEHAVDYPDLDPTMDEAMYSRPVPPVVVLTMDYERADSHGSYNIATCRADPMQEPQPRWLWRNAVTQCFNVLSEAFFYVSYSEMRYNQSIPPIWHRRSLTAGANFVRLWNRQIFLMHGCHTTTYDREFKVERSRIDTLGIDWNETTETNTKTFNGYDTRDNDRSDPYNTASRQVFVDDDFMIITTHRGYFVHSFHSSNSSGWLPKSAGGPQDLEEAHSAADPGETSSIQPPEALDLYERTDAIKLYATARARG